MESGPRRRRRIARSCVQCRRRKIKCDRKDPCTHCVVTQLRCIYKGYGDQPASLPQDRDEIPEVGNLAPLLSESDRRGRSSTAQDIWQGSPPITRSPAPTTTTTQIGTCDPSNPNERQPSIHTHHPSPNLTDLLRRVEALEKYSEQTPAGSLSETNQAILERPSRIESSEWIFSKTRIMRWSLWMGTAKEVPMICFLLLCLTSC